MNFRNKDKDFQGKIAGALFERHKININKDVGTAYLQPESEDRVNPQVTISTSEIKAHTGREKLRNVILDEYIEAFNKHPSLSAKKITDDSISVSVDPIRSRDNEFNSLSALSKKNKSEIYDDPELGEDIDW